MHRSREFGAQAMLGRTLHFASDRHLSGARAIGAKGFAAHRRGKLSAAFARRKLNG